jgi:hypothetical protein
VRQWVSSLPFGLRWRGAFDHELARALARITQAEIERRYRRLAARAACASPAAAPSPSCSASPPTSGPI